MSFERTAIEQQVDSPLDFLSKHEPLQDPKFLNEAIDSFGRHTKEFGIDNCKEVAAKIFNVDVLNNWEGLTKDEKVSLIQEYSQGVANSFQLIDYKGVIIEQMEGRNGYSKGDGYIHLSSHFLNSQVSPIQVVDTITHELRHQYQTECVMGYHFIPVETKLEWLAGFETYTTEMPWANDPIGYKYNPLETDARHAGESVAQSLAKDYLSSKYA